MGKGAHGAGKVLDPSVEVVARLTPEKEAPEQIVKIL